MSVLQVILIPAFLIFIYRISGIARFFDDEVNEVLGIPEDEALLYITTIGRARRE